ncbi:MAG: carboxypeptidase regulatory-like domain-containing protein [Bryobacterales bacterium]|nr:carboxypeptidase regulatory-like domain-containing protein [Bryobacterales bacterium]
MSAGQQRTGLVITMLERRAIPVRGRFAGEVAGSEHYYLMASLLRSDRRGAESTGARVEKDGSFAHTVSAGGRYRLSVFSRPSGPGQPITVGSLEVTVPETGLDDVIIPATPIHRITARTRWAPGAARPDAPPAIEFSLNPMEGLGIMQHSKRESDGSLVVARVSPDRYSILGAKLPAGLYVQSVEAGGTAITSRGLDLITGSATDLSFSIASDGGSVSGRVVDSAGRAVSGAHVSISRDSPHRPEQELWSRYSVTGTDGEFDPVTLAPGEYRIYCRVADRAAPVQRLLVKPNERARVDIVLPQ